MSIVSNNDVELSVENAIPVLAVADLPASSHFYEQILGFKVDWQTPTVMQVSRDAGRIMLQKALQRLPGTVWIGLGENYFAQLWNRLRQVPDLTIVERPTNQSYALEMKIKDLDGDLLWFGTDALRDVTFGQEVTENQLAQSHAKIP